MEDQLVLFRKIRKNVADNLKIINSRGINVIKEMMDLNQRVLHIQEGESILKEYPVSSEGRVFRNRNREVGL